MKSEYKRVVTQASAEMLARWILKNLDWSGGNDEANGAFLTSILLEHRKQASTPTPEERESKDRWMLEECRNALIAYSAAAGINFPILADLDAYLKPQRGSTE